MEIPRIIGAGLIVLGVGIGLGKIGAAALEGMARQPEQAGKLQTAMLIAAALVEGEQNIFDDEPGMGDEDFRVEVLDDP